MGQTVRTTNKKLSSQVATAHTAKAHSCKKSNHTHTCIGDINSWETNQIESVTFWTKRLWENLNAKANILSCRCQIWIENRWPGGQSAATTRLEHVDIFCMKRYRQKDNFWTKNIFFLCGIFP